ncbi:hypothetical protein [Alcaligenes faecalis]|uniref:hypothetical protein n=1 Tax=Alcaligenes faecalis TaxID=511 RepID=UPI001C83E0EE|nr:hypothetical protein [Alcaligenes faecalis]MBX6965408.1 hypothetical protein [Providencia rettgeri]MBX7030889.1 hypothetical protein [Alcaligenes faecalis]
MKDLQNGDAVDAKDLIPTRGGYSRSRMGVSEKEQQPSLSSRNSTDVHTITPATMRGYALSFRGEASGQDRRQVGVLLAKRPLGKQPVWRQADLPYLSTG